MLRIKELRDAAGLTQERLGELVGVTHAAIQRWESGKRQIPSGRIKKLAEELGVHPGELFAGMPRESLSGLQRKAAELASKLPAHALTLWLQMGEQLLMGGGAPSRDLRRRSTAR